MIFFYLLSTWLSDLYITKNCVFCWYTTAEKRKFDFFQSLNHVDVNLKPRFLIKSGYHIVPSPSTALAASIDVRLQGFLSCTIIKKKLGMHPWCTKWIIAQWLRSIFNFLPRIKQSFYLLKAFVFKGSPLTAADLGSYLNFAGKNIDVFKSDTLISLINVEVGINVEGVQKLPNH